MPINNIKHLIDIVESKQFSDTYYKHFLLTEELPTSQNRTSKLLMGGGLALGAGLLGNHLVQSNPELKHQLSDAASSVSSSVKQVGSTISSGIKTVTDKAENLIKSGKDQMEWNTHTKPNLTNANADQLKADHDWIIAKKTADWNKMSEQQHNELKNADTGITNQIRKLETTGHSTTQYSKSFNPKDFDSISTQDEKNEAIRTAAGGGLLKGNLAVGKDMLNRGLQTVSNAGAELKDIGKDIGILKR